jgi:hypothetical protein
MSSLVLSGDTSGSITVSAPAVAGSNTQTLVATTGTLAPIVSGTVVTTTGGTSIDFTSIPSWVKRITVMFNGVSLSSTASFLIQLGDAGGIENTSYVSLSTLAASTVSTASSTSGFLISAGTAARSYQGVMQICLVTSNTWVEGGNFNDGVGNTISSSGAKTLSDTLTQIRITSTSTDTFDVNGGINILYE